jgi:tetratricopeptide (TPR) repeat protein
VLFDLRSGKRRRVVQVVYGFLAALFLLGFVLFGIGGDVSLDPTELFGGGGGSTNGQFEDQIDDAEQRLEQNPEDERALRNLAELRYQSGRSQLDVDEQTGQPIVTEDARSEFEAAADAWLRYVKVGSKPDAATAGQITQAFFLLNDFAEAAKAYRIVAEDNPSSGTYGQLAFFLYADGQIGAGDEVAARAVAEAEPAERVTVRKELARYSKLAAEQKKALAKLPEGGAGGEGELQNPFGGLGPGGGAPALP